MGVIKTSKENATPEIPPAGFCKLYFKTDGGLYRLDEAGIETLISDTDVLAKVSSNDTIAKYLEDAIIVANGTNSTNALEISTINDGGDEDIEISFDETKLSVTSSQITDFSTAVTNAETDTTLQKIGNTLRYIGEDGTNQDIDLSTYLDDTNLARLVSGTINPTTGIATFTRDDATTFTLDLSSLIDIETVTTLTESPAGVFKYTSEDATQTTIDISGLSGASHTQNTDTSLDFGNTNQVTASELRTHLDDVTIHFTQAAISITASQVSDFDTEVSNNTDVAANTGARHDAVTLNVDAPTQESAILVGQEIQLNQATTVSDGVMSSEDKTKLDGIASGANNYVHPNHTGEVTSTGDGAQTLDKTAISNQTEVTVATDDYVLIGDTSDTDNLKKVTVQSIADLGGGGGNSQEFAYFKNNSPFLQSSNTAYEDMSQIFYMGSTSFNITTGKIVVYVSNGTGTFRIYDITNAQTIAEVSYTNTSVAIIDIGTISNLPSGEAIFAIQLKHAGTGENRLSSLFLKE